MNSAPFYNNLSGTISNSNNNVNTGNNIANNGSNHQGVPGASSTWINKLKIVGRGQNWAVAPCEPFYLMGTESPAYDTAITGVRNLIEHYGLENAYQKFCGKRLKEELSAFLPHLSGNIDVPASVDGSGLMSLIEKPPIRGKDLRPFASNQLDQAFRLHPGPLPQEYSLLFAAAPPNKHNHRNTPQDQAQTQQLLTSGGACVGNGSRLPATAAPNLAGSSNQYNQRKRRYEVHRGPGSVGVGGIGSTLGNTTGSGPMSFFTTPPSAFPQLGPIHTGGGTLSSGSLPPPNHTTLPAHGSSLVSSVHSLSNHVLDSLINSTKPGDLPPGLIPVSNSAAPNIPFSSEAPPPLLAPIHQNITQRIMNNNPSQTNITHSNVNPDLVSSNTIAPAGPGIQSTIGAMKPNIPAPPLLQSIHTSNSNMPNTNSSHLPHSYGINMLHHSQSYPTLQINSRSLSPNIKGPSVSPPSPDIYNKIRHSDLTEEERRRKKRREKKRRKDKD